MIHHASLPLTLAGTNATTNTTHGSYFCYFTPFPFIAYRSSLLHPIIFSSSLYHPRSRSKVSFPSKPPTLTTPSTKPQAHTPSYRITNPAWLPPYQIHHAFYTYLSRSSSKGQRSRCGRLPRAWARHLGRTDDGDAPTNGSLSAILYWTVVHEPPGENALRACGTCASFP